MYAQVIVDIVHENVDRTFTYLVPEGMDLQPGQRVEVPFGRRSREGVVLALTEECSLPPEKVRPVKEPLEPWPAILPELIDLARHLAEQNRCPLAETLRLMLPAEMRGGRVQVKTQPVCRLAIPAEEVEDAIARQGRSRKRRLVLSLLKDGRVHPLGELALLVREYVRLGGHQLQLNTVDGATLKDAQQHPEKYQNLIVRIWGWSAYFVELDKPYQDHVIARAEYRL